MKISGLPGNNKGVSLIELLIAVALTGMIMSLGYALYFFGTGSFERGTAQAQAQHNARLADEYLKAELRNAINIEIDSTGREGEFDGYFRLAEGFLVKTGERVTGNTIVDLAVRIVTQGNRAILEYEVKSRDNNEVFVFTNKILLNNISASAFDASYAAFRSLNITSGGFVLYYSKEVERYTLTMAVSPADGGIATDLGGASPYAAGTAVSIRAAASPGFRFVSWTAPAGSFGNAAAPETTFTMPAQNVTVTANYVRVYTLTMAVSPTNAGTAVDLTGLSAHAEGTAVSIRATANPGFRFLNWTASAGSFANANAAETAFTMPAQNVTVTAYFVVDFAGRYGLTMSASPDGGGTAVDLTGMPPYAPGTAVDIRAAANPGFRFVNWTAPAGSFGNAAAPETTFTMPAQDVTVTANFEVAAVERFNLTMAVSPPAGGTATDLSGASPYTAGTAVSIRATANPGFRFLNWTAPAGSFANANAAETTFTMPAQNVTATANLWPGINGFIYNHGLFANEWVPGFQDGGGSQSRQTNHLYLLASQGSGRATRTYVTSHRVHLTNVARIRIEWENTGDSSNHNESYLVVSTSQTGSHTTFNRRLRVTRNFTPPVFNELTVGDLSGDFFIRVHARENHGNHDRSSVLRVYSIQLIYE